MVSHMVRYYVGDRASSSDFDDYGMRNDIVDQRGLLATQRGSCLFLGESPRLRRERYEEISSDIYLSTGSPMQSRDDFNVIDEEIKSMFRSSQQAARVEARTTPEHHETIDLVDQDLRIPLISTRADLKNFYRDYYFGGENRSSFIPDDETLHETSRAMQLRHKKRQLESRNKPCTLRFPGTEVPDTPSQRSIDLRRRKRDIERRYSSAICSLTSETF